MLVYNGSNNAHFLHRLSCRQCSDVCRGNSIRANGLHIFLYVIYERNRRTEDYFKGSENSLLGVRGKAEFGTKMTKLPNGEFRVVMAPRSARKSSSRINKKLISRIARKSNTRKLPKLVQNQKIFFTPKIVNMVNMAINISAL